MWYLHYGNCNWKIELFGRKVDATPANLYELVKDKLEGFEVGVDGDCLDAFSVLIEHSPLKHTIRCQTSEMRICGNTVTAPHYTYHHEIINGCLPLTTCHTNNMNDIRQQLSSGVIIEAAYGEDAICYNKENCRGIPDIERIRITLTKIRPSSSVFGIKLNRIRY